MFDRNAEIGQSRDAVSEVLLGMRLRYVTDPRMRIAAQWLTQENSSVADVADRLGYASQAAFTRAFKRVIGKPPVKYRRRAG